LALPWEEEEAAAAAQEAAGIGGRAGDEDLDPAQRPLVEGGEGVAEGFELAEEELVEAAQHGESDADPLADAFTTEAEGEHAIGEHGEADHEDSSEAPGSDR
jgi:hypothetical protein